LVTIIYNINQDQKANILLVLLQIVFEIME